MAEIKNKRIVIHVATPTSTVYTYHPVLRCIWTAYIKHDLGRLAYHRTTDGKRELGFYNATLSSDKQFQWLKRYLNSLFKREKLSAYTVYGCGSTLYDPDYDDVLAWEGKKLD